MERVSTLFLKIAVFIIGLPVFAAILQRLLQEAINLNYPHFHFV
ncbi:hypothetical protein SZ39_2615 [Bacillus mycoides]|nr:hypothetical protein SZ39_2615 [Bacillus mycoides]